jgi:hypothetical protein
MLAHKLSRPPRSHVACVGPRASTLFSCSDEPRLPCISCAHFRPSAHRVAKGEDDRLEGGTCTHPSSGTFHIVSGVHHHLRASSMRASPDACGPLGVLHERAHPLRPLFWRIVVLLPSGGDVHAHWEHAWTREALIWTGSGLCGLCFLLLRAMNCT